MRRRPRVLGTLALLLAVGCTGGGSGSLEGTVTGADGPVADAAVTLTPGEDTTTTDAAGHFAFPELAAGDYVVSVSAEGYEVAVSEPHTVAADGTTTVDLQLTAFVVFASSCESCHFREGELLASLAADPLPEDPNESGSAGEG